MNRKNHIPKAFFITGTGTGVGKTIVTAAIASHLLSLGRNVAVMKPVQTGLSESAGDLATISSLVPGIVDLPRDIACPYSFPLPASPALAAADAGKRISTARIISAYRKCISYPGLDILLVEGAGGLMVPLSGKFMMIDLISNLKTPVILVADAGLGTINHTLLSIEAMERRSINIAGIILNRMPSVKSLVEKDNPYVLEKLSGVPVIATLPVLYTSAGSAKFASNVSSCLKKTNILHKIELTCK